MTQISVKLPGDLIASVDAAAYQLRRTRGNYGDSSLICIDASTGLFKSFHLSW